MSVIVVADGVDFLSLMTEFSTVNATVSSSPAEDKFLGSSFESSKNSPRCMSLLYFAGTSWKKFEAALMFGLRRS